MEFSSLSSGAIVETLPELATEKRHDIATWNWDDDPQNPYNWPIRLKIQQVLMIASAAFTTSVQPYAQQYVHYILTSPGPSVFLYYRLLTQSS